MEKPIDPVQITHENIEAIYQHEKCELAKQSLLEKAINKVAAWAGTVHFITAHLIFFILWIGIQFTGWAFDEFPFVLLITVVSLEAILLQGMLLLSQNKLADEADKRHKLDLQINLLAERESTAILRLLEKVAQKLEIEEEHRKEAQGLSDDTSPTDVLEQIVKVEQKP